MPKTLAAVGAPDRDFSASGDGACGFSWDDLRIIKTLSECGSRSVAAARLGINASTVSRRVAQAEAALGVALFDRRRAGYTLTAEGMELRALSERVELDVVSVARRVAGGLDGPLGTLRLTTSDSLLLHFLTPIIAEFKASHPSLCVQVLVGNDTLDLARDESDIAIRATRSPSESLVGRKLASIAWAPYGSASQFGRKRPSADALYGLAWVSYAGRLSGLRAAQYVDNRVAPANIAYRSDSVAAVGAGVAAGLGMGFLPCMLGDLMPELVRVGPIVPELQDELWLLTHPDIRRARRVQAFMSFCATAVARRKALIEGREPIEPARL
ncbi:LysR family transcriptional regulator [Paracidovorax citrulli]